MGRFPASRSYQVEEIRKIYLGDSNAHCILSEKIHVFSAFRAHLNLQLIFFVTFFCGRVGFLYMGLIYCPPRLNIISSERCTAIVKGSIEHKIFTSF